MPSEKILQTKKQEVDEIAAMIKKSASVILMDYQGLKVDQDTEMRKQLREAGISYKVVKNSILEFAFKQLGYEGFEEHFKGPSAIACSEDPVAPSKVLSKFAKEHDCIELKVGLLENEKIDVERIGTLATLPSHEELIGKVVGGISAPLYGLAYVLTANLRGLAIALNAIAEKQQEA